MFFASRVGATASSFGEVPSATTLRAIPVARWSRGSMAGADGPQRMGRRRLMALSASRISS